MTIDPNEAAASLHDIATVERRTREAALYARSGSLFLLWGVLVACGQAGARSYPRPAGIIWLVVSAVGCAGTVLIVAVRMQACPREVRDWRLIWAMLALVAYGAAWSYLLGPVVPRPMIYAFQPSLYLVGMILAGL